MTTVLKDSEVPLYLQVSEWIRENIYQGDLTTGDRVPSENQIMDMLGVSRGTVKKAVTMLVNEGMLVQVQGKGTFVKSENISYSLGEGLLSFAESLESQHLHFETEVIESRKDVASKLVASKLGIEVGAPILYLKRVRSVEGEKVMLIENRINISHCPGIEDIDFNSNNLFPTVERLSGKKIASSESRYAAKIIGAERGHYLEVHEDAPVLHLEQIVYFENNIPLEFGNVWLKSDKYYLGTVLQRRER
ncbi:DNA-binding GntR family transcriptional regulator [Pantoea agglomerans]|uniref:GntR family transcriptional regulator n=1 Tax=Enterobacter agglomerans TaxID=549 RepID=UPI0015F95DB2|nr:GntR family transcriptional regulator [Pantoea agglomerans]MBA8867091.1 DNA-binding GntR family transcriptional regulator [Pantoea agglomerans]MBA8894151.1 DNA-binding GntR family transcriptional regulator [Pantoea agglomerans]